ncbi:MAG: DUF3362 domain-containing protein, partial [Oscillospiraceae bacterium]|nr:DUF3362 domain-containing protein [Oscillospiraceae bacterium]
AARVREALRKAGRTDLIGTGRKCLVPPAPKERTADRSRTPQGSRHGATAGKKSSTGAKRAKKKTKKRT